jgi:ring-1,2-phenylacetyl-CoA epoxidase subunit PaaE
MTPRFHTLTISDIRRECGDAFSLAFQVPPELAGDYAFLPGQHIGLRADVDGEPLRRSYSLCSTPGSAELRVGIREVPGGRFSNWASRKLGVGDRIDVMTPDGRFCPALDAAHRKHYAAFAAGSGITPVLSIAGAVLASEPLSRVTVVYGNRQLASAMFLEELGALKDGHLGRFVLHNVFSREPQDVPLFEGRLDGARVREFAATLLPVETIDEAFVCGPGAMIDEVEAALIDLGMPPDRVHVERFGVPSDAGAHRLEAGDAPQSNILVELDGARRQVEFRAGDASILEAALRAGLDLPYSCKGGMCCTCRARVTRGEVRMDKNYSLDAADVAAGFVLTCQAHPLTERVEVSFDAR